MEVKRILTFGGFVKDREYPKDTVDTTSVDYVAGDSTGRIFMTAGNTLKQLAVREANGDVSIIKVDSSINPTVLKLSPDEKTLYVYDIRTSGVSERIVAFSTQKPYKFIGQIGPSLDTDKSYGGYKFQVTDTHLVLMYQTQYNDLIIEKQKLDEPDKRTWDQVGSFEDSYSFSILKTWIFGDEIWISLNGHSNLLVVVSIQTGKLIKRIPRKQYGGCLIQEVIDAKKQIFACGSGWNDIAITYIADDGSLEVLKTLTGFPKEMEIRKDRVVYNFTYPTLSRSGHLIVTGSDYFPMFVFHMKPLRET